MKTAEAIIFYIIALSAIAGAVGVIFSHKIARSILFAFVSFANIGLLFFILEQPYLAVAQIALYAVGTSIIFIFALMLTRKDKENELTAALAPRTFLTVLGSICITYIIALFIKYHLFSENAPAEQYSAVIMPSINETSIQMFINYGAPFIFSAFLFLSVILTFGVIFSSHKGGKK